MNLLTLPEPWPRVKTSVPDTEKGFITFAAFGRLCSPTPLRRETEQTFFIPHFLPRVFSTVSIIKGFKARQPDFHLLYQNQEEPPVARSLCASLPPPVPAHTYADPPHPYPIEKQALTKHQAPRSSGRRILPKKPERCVSQFRPITATH